MGTKNETISITRSCINKINKNLPSFLIIKKRQEMKIIVQDEIEREVIRIWSESPGTGIKQLVEKLEALELSSEITKKRVKAAKQAIPYAYIKPLKNQASEGCEEAQSGDVDVNVDVNIDGNVNIDEQEGASQNAELLNWTKEQISFVEQKIQERTSVRSLRRYRDADEIEKGLTAMGIILDDGMKTWTIGPQKTSQISENDLSKEEIMAQQQQQQNGVACKFCNRYFASKNLVFRHLRDVSTSCGNAIFANGEKVPDAPSAVVKREKQESARALRRKKTGKAKQKANPKATLWFGDLPIPYTRLGGQYRRLRAVLREYLPRDVPQPWIKRVVRKAYRKGGTITTVNREGSHENENDANSVLEKEVGGDDDADNVRGEYFGYAIIVFRDEVEADSVKAAIDGTIIKSDKVFPSESDALDMPSFVIRVKNVLHNQSASASSSPSTNKDTDTEDNHHVGAITSSLDQETSGGQDPPLRDQLRPLSIPELKERHDNLSGRLQNISTPVTDIDRDEHIEKDNENAKQQGTSLDCHPDQDHNIILEKVVSLYEALGAREEVFHQGRIIPDSIRKNLINLLQNVRWPAASHRKGLTSDHYLVLQTNVANDRFYNDLRIGCRELMEWADPDYYYSGIAVTKNFVASPHIDDRDESFQYAVSLGEFEGGGELCVEGRRKRLIEKETLKDIYYDYDYVNVVDTRNRIAKVDGRNVHWVRSWSGREDRYSLIFYDTTERHQTDIIESGVDVTFVE